MSKLFFRSALILCLGSWSASTAFSQQVGQQVTLTIHDGRVTLKATNATVRQILDEWSRVGGTKIVNGEKLSGQPVTLTITDQPEGQALETVLRTAAGYMVAERDNPTPTGSRFEKIMLMGRTTPVSATASAANAYTTNGPTPPGGTFGPEGPVNADDDEQPPQPAAPVVNPYAHAASAGAPGTVSGTNAGGVPGSMGTGVGQQTATAASQSQPAAQPNPGYSNVYGQAAVYGQGAAANSAGSLGTEPVGAASNPPEVKFDYANPQKYFSNRPQQQGNPMQPYPGIPLSPTSAGTGAGTQATTPQAPATVPGTGAAGTVTPTVPPGTPANQNPYSPNFNPYNLPAGQGVPVTPTTGTPTTPVEPDRAKYANPYQQPQQP